MDALNVRKTFAESPVTWPLRYLFKEEVDNSSDVFPVKDITDMRLDDNGAKVFNVAWYGYPGQNTWEPKENVPEYLVMDFKERRQKEILAMKLFHRVITVIADIDKLL